MVFGNPEERFYEAVDADNGGRIYNGSGGVPDFRRKNKNHFAAYFCHCAEMLQKEGEEVFKVSIRQEGWK